MLTINAENFNEIVSAPEVTLVDFYADWCVPCKMIAPLLEKLSSNHRIGKVNVDELAEITAQQGVGSIPALFFFKGGQVVKKLVGNQSQAAIVKAFEELK